jgi:hypothetical protein
LRPTVTGARFQADVLRWLLKVLPFLSPKHESLLSKGDISDHLNERPYSTVRSLPLSECNEHEVDVPTACPQGLLLWHFSEVALRSGRTSKADVPRGRRSPRQPDLLLRINNDHRAVQQL